MTNLDLMKDYPDKYFSLKVMLESQEAGDDDGWITVSRHTSKKSKPLGYASS